MQPKPICLNTLPFNLSSTRVHRHQCKILTLVLITLLHRLITHYIRLNLGISSTFRCRRANDADGAKQGDQIVQILAHWAIFLKTTEVARILLFINFGKKNQLGCVLGDFFTNSSGRRGANRTTVAMNCDASTCAMARNC
jgi:hypothetical protein